jgi:hypothetical protein
MQQFRYRSKHHQDLPHVLTKGDVSEFWSGRSWDLDLPSDGSLSNCVYCFLKGVGNLDLVHRSVERADAQEIEGFGPTSDTTCDIAWWVKMEGKYGRDLVAENRRRTGTGDVEFVGFFGASSRFSYDVLSTSRAIAVDQEGRSTAPRSTIDEACAVEERPEEAA